MTKLQKEELKLFMKSELRFADKTGYGFADYLFASDATYEFLSVKYPHMEIKNAYKIVSETLSEVLTEESLNELEN